MYFEHLVIANIKVKIKLSGVIVPILTQKIVRRVMIISHGFIGVVNFLITMIHPNFLAITIPYIGYCMPRHLYYIKFM